MKLVQKQFLKGTSEFEIGGDTVYVRIKKPFKEEKLALSLATLDPEPVINGASVEFYGRDNAGPLLSLLMDKPSPDEFSVFVTALRQRMLEAFSTFSGNNANESLDALGGNVYEAPPEFEEADPDSLNKKTPAVNSTRLENDILLLEQYLDAEDIRPFLSALEALKSEPENEACLLQVIKEYNDLGAMQGAVLTYAPYITVLLSYNVVGDKDWIR